MTDMKTTARAALKETLAAYLSAGLAAGANSPAISPTAKITENGAPAQAYDGMWASAKTLPFTQAFADTETGQVACHGAVNEGEWLAAFAVRLKVEDGVITEVERLIARRGEASAMTPHRMKTQPLFDQAVAPPQPRVALIAAADLYFDAVQNADGSIAPLSEACDRIENGLQTTNNPAAGLGSNARSGMMALSYIKNVRDRRYPLVDPENGVVWSVATFDVPPGGVLRLKMGDEIVERPQVPRTIHVTEAFKIEDGLITAIDVIVKNGPEHQSLGWN